MATGAPAYCTACGDPLTLTDHPDLYHCRSCGEYTFDSPSPNARVVVVDSVASKTPRAAGVADSGDSVASEMHRADGTSGPVDSDRLLLVEIADEARLEDPPYAVDSEWMTPGGHIELGEQPHEAAARELREETGLVVDPDALVLFEAVSREVVEGKHGLTLLYAVDRAETTGTPVAADDASDARFWSPGELAASEGRFRVMHDEPAEHRELGWLLERAKRALPAD